MIMVSFLFVIIVCCLVWFTEETKIGQKLSNKLYDYFMKK